jgi:hypothetical protein
MRVALLLLCAIYITPPPQITPRTNSLFLQAESPVDYGILFPNPLAETGSLALGEMFNHFFTLMSAQFVIVKSLPQYNVVNCIFPKLGWTIKVSPIVNLSIKKIAVLRPSSVSFMFKFPLFDFDLKIRVNKDFFLDMAVFVQYKNSHIIAIVYD